MIDDGLQGDFIVAYDGSFNPQLTEYLIQGLVGGRLYRLKVYATDTNGRGTESPIVEQISCIEPAEMQLPILESVSKTTYTLSWSLPLFVGGCPITGFGIFRDDGNNGPLDIEVDKDQLDGRSDVLQHTSTING